MKFSRIFPIFLIFSIGGAVAGIPELGAVSQVGTGRIGDNVVRYVKTFNDSCLVVQVLSAENNWAVLSTSNVCSFEGKKFDFDFSDVGFDDISVKEDGIHFILSLTPLRPIGEQRRNCVIPIASASIKKLSCSEADR
ncbi:hypothetical protein [Pseudomonas sp. ICMP 460]|uniref:hypothetical protein n=1 Tax=Pseudomonas TaxID=286 RepID=UPI00117B5CF5|nr:hypothetical protein [Pseudomonas sp. ICMP 460]